MQTHEANWITSIGEELPEVLRRIFERVEAREVAQRTQDTNHETAQRRLRILTDESQL